VLGSTSSASFASICDLSIAMGLQIRSGLWMRARILPEPDTKYHIVFMCVFAAVVDLGRAARRFGNGPEPASPPFREAHGSFPGRPGQ
jgi:hypothetical protein